MKKIFLSIGLLFFTTYTYAKVNVIVSIAPQKAYVEQIEYLELIDCYNLTLFSDNLIDFYI
ncbi:MAG: hypothetical protein U9O56_00400 [Campylobacterota bacterium]|nr:hypothetical protein [Campylobacterota bacterium]